MKSGGSSPRSLNQPRFHTGGGRCGWNRCHDTGHLPFSHAAEKELLPEGWDHERLTREIILSRKMAGIWTAMTPPLRPMDVVKLAVGPGRAKDVAFSV